MYISDIRSDQTPPWAGVQVDWSGQAVINLLFECPYKCYQLNLLLLASNAGNWLTLQASNMKLDNEMMPQPVLPTNLIDCFDHLLQSQQGSMESLKGLQLLLEGGFVPVKLLVWVKNIPGKIPPPPPPHNL